MATGDLVFLSRTNLEWFTVYFVRNHNHNIKHSHSVNSLKDDGGSAAACSKRLQTRRGLPQIHGCDQNAKEHLEQRGQCIMAAKTFLTGTRQKWVLFFSVANWEFHMWSFFSEVFIKAALFLFCLHFFVHVSEKDWKNERGNSKGVRKKHQEACKKFLSQHETKEKNENDVFLTGRKSLILPFAPVHQSVGTKKKHIVAFHPIMVNVIPAVVFLVCTPQCPPPG